MYKNIKYIINRYLLLLKRNNNNISCKIKKNDNINNDNINNISNPFCSSYKNTKKYLYNKVLINDIIDNYFPNYRKKIKN